MIFNIIHFTVPMPNGAENGCDTKLFDLAKSVHWIVDDSNYAGEGGLKRRMLPGNDDSDDEGATVAPPANDIYRIRQQKRFHRS